MQYIQPDGIKRFAKNSRREGCFHVVGGMDALRKAPAVVIAEGYATAASVKEALGHAVVTAFDAVKSQIGSVVERQIEKRQAAAEQTKTREREEKRKGGKELSRV